MPVHPQPIREFVRFQGMLNHVVRPRFGATTSAPPTPKVSPVTGDWSSSDLLTYTAFVNARVKEMDKSWAAWHDASQWDNGGAGCTQQQVADLTAQVDAGKITVEQAAKICHQEYYDQLSKADDWSKNVVTGGGGNDNDVACTLNPMLCWASGGSPSTSLSGSGLFWEGWPAWSNSFHQVANKIAENSTWQGISEWAYSRIPWVQARQNELIDYAKKANAMGLKNVADPGAPLDFNVDIPDLPKTADVTSLINSLTMLAVVGGGIYLLASRRRTR